MPYVLDATALRSGVSTQDKSQWFTTPGVINEIQRGKVSRDLELAIEISITVMAPGEEAHNKIMETARKTGDDGRLSATDIELLALAWELKATIVSDDYSVQNVASILKIPIKTNLEGIRKIIHWTYRCRGCGRYFEKKEPDCPICGSEVRTVGKKS
jgi:UPF0271 protein